MDDLYANTRNWNGPDDEGRVQYRPGADTGNEVIITSTPEADPDKMTPITIRSGL